MSTPKNASSRLACEQVWDAEVIHTHEELSHLSDMEKLKLGMVFLKIVNDSNGDEKCLAVSVVHINNQELLLSLDTGATTNILSYRAVEMVSLSSEQMRPVVTVASRAKFGAVGKLLRTPVMFEGMQAKLGYIVFKNVSFNAVIVHQTVRSHYDVLAFFTKTVQLQWFA